MPTLEEYMAMSYPMNIDPGEESGYVVTSPDLPGIIAHNDDLADAVRKAEELRALHLEVMIEGGDPIPLPGEFKSCGGALTIRIPISLHRQLKLRAKREKVSLNQYAASLLAQAG